ncbi:MAG TPA: IS200/IS605 family transposase [Bacteroidales bacterium]|nr:IS200/IS605 family transposase [Bacteroidales bacterium]HRX96725.1 IS200/IS605 family transposase [Bacteroidales bacterium]
MANTFTQIYIHFIFAVKGRDRLIGPNWEDELYKYITGIIQNSGHKLLAIGGMPDHLHIFTGMKPDHSVSELMRLVKSNSSKWINEKRFTRTKFQWQEGFGAFSYANSQLDSVIGYINRQKEHHKRQSFKAEYLEILEKFKVEFDLKYILNEVEELYQH